MSTLRHCARCGKDYPADASFCPEDGTPLASAEAGPKAGQVLDDRYLLEKRIGAGGLGEIYRARHLRMHRAFAVKLLHPGMVNRPDFVGRFDREARALSRLTHPCCVAVTDYGISGEHGPYIVMELVDGVPLSTFTRGEGLPLGEAVDLVIAVLAGLEHAHGQGIVHRDIKPDNIMVVKQPLEPSRQMPKILDFGLARIRAGFDAPAGQTLTETGFVIGTPHYLPPERVMNPTADDPRSDIYAVGVILYELCCGRRPFEADETPRVVELHLTEPPPPPRSLRPELPAALEAAILRALEKKPEARFASAAAFRVALQQLLPLPREIADRRPAPPGEIQSATRLERPPPPLLARRSPRGLRPWHLLALGAAILVLGSVALGVVLFRDRERPPPAGSTARRDVGQARAVAPRRKPLPSPRPPSSPGAKSGPAAEEVGGPPASSPSTAEDTRQGKEGEAEGEAAHGEGKADAADDSASEEPPSAAAASHSLPAEIRQAYGLWTRKWGRSRGARQFMSYLARHPKDVPSLVFVGRLYLYALWTSDGVKLIQRALQADPRLRLDAETLMGLAFAFRGSSTYAARTLIDAHGGADAPGILLAAAAVMRDRSIKQSLLANGRRRKIDDPLSRALLALAEAVSCERRRQALRALPTVEPPHVRVMVSMLRSNRCLGHDAREMLQRSK